MMSLPEIFERMGWLASFEEHDGEWVMIDWHGEGDPPSEDEVTTAIQEQRLASVFAEIKAEAGRRIEALYPPHVQNNANADVTALLFAGRETWTAEQAAEVEEIHAAWQWISGVREYSNKLEQAVARMSPEELEGFDPTADPGWPG